LEVQHFGHHARLLNGAVSLFNIVIVGRKTEAPWVWLYSEGLSPSAPIGFYVGIHFALNVQRRNLDFGRARNWPTVGAGSEHG
jgi:hypothetical protein